MSTGGLSPEEFVRSGYVGSIGIGLRSLKSTAAEEAGFISTNQVEN
jgi:hypothetical protein